MSGAPPVCREPMCGCPPRRSPSLDLPLPQRGLVDIAAVQPLQLSCYIARRRQLLACPTRLIASTISSTVKSPPMRVEGNSLWPAPTPFQGTNLRVPVPTRSLVYSRNRRRKTLFSDYSDGLGGVPSRAPRPYRFVANELDVVGVSDSIVIDDNPLPKNFGDATTAPCLQRGRCA